MKTILHLMTLSETREYGHLKHETYEHIKTIVQKPFVEVTVKDFFELAGTNIFDVNFADLLFNELWKRFVAPVKDIKTLIE